MTTTPSAVTQPLLEVADLRVSFPVPAGTIQAVKGVSFTVEPGRILGIVGESGSGKSVTARATMRMLREPGRVAQGPGIPLSPSVFSRACAACAQR